jgi:hypothetical protein
MIDEIRQVLSEHLPADKADEIAQAISDKLDPECVSEEDAVKFIFSPQGFILFKNVEKALTEQGDDLSKVEKTYNKIKNVCKGVHNGIMLLALAETLSALLVGMLKQVNEMKNNEI